MVARELLVFLPLHGEATTVVGEEKHVGVVLQTKRLDFVHHRSNAIIKVLGHGGELRHGVLFALGQALGFFERVFAIKNIEVHRVVRHLNEERLTAPGLRFHEVTSALGQATDQFGVILGCGPPGSL